MANSGLYEEWCQNNEMMPSDAAKAGWCMTCGVWANRVSWAAALMVVRYGEEPSSWPAAFSDQDVVRAENWLAGRVPGAVVSANKRGV